MLWDQFSPFSNTAIEGNLLEWGIKCLFCGLSEVMSRIRVRITTVLRLFKPS